jgi:hypothetical protein
MKHRSIPPWQAYHRAVQEAKAARARLLGGIFSLAHRHLKGRICARARKWNIRVCLHCC